ncbi:hypothetical protein AVEN_15834-1 [Araneus ventricosus]|uniref:Uncharacterized protein n=1 Tax=Araneus ventricosus TaxID=182803 RepID=A0A4Y2LMP2_ARAVE|nr:hypothetical protein AVEN_15834-1 [Araneus ventricosus]
MVSKADFMSEKLRARDVKGILYVSIRIMNGQIWLCALISQSDCGVKMTDCSDSATIAKLEERALSNLYKVGKTDRRYDVKDQDLPSLEKKKTCSISRCSGK